MHWNASPEKRIFDRAVSTALVPVDFTARHIVQRLIARSCDCRVQAVETQTRIGVFEQPFDLLKFRSIDPCTGQFFSNWAAMMQKLGVDEIAQLENVRRGEMGLIGRRPILSEEHAEVMDNLPPRLGAVWQGIGKYYLPGIISSYGLDLHVRGVPDATDYERRAELDIQDAFNTSPVYDAKLAQQFIGLALARRFQ